MWGTQLARTAPFTKKIVATARRAPRGTVSPAPRELRIAESARSPTRGVDPRGTPDLGHGRIPGTFSRIRYSPVCAVR